MYDPGNNLQVWLSMPGRNIQSSALFWFRTVPALVDPNFTQITANLAAFLANSIGYTSTQYNHGAYLHAYVFYQVPPFGTQFRLIETGFPGIPPMPVDMMPSMSTLVVHTITDPYIQQARWSMSYTPKSWVTGSLPGLGAITWLNNLNATYPSGFLASGVHFIPVLVSYKAKEWYDVLGFELAPRLGGRRRRQAGTRDRLIGHIPKILPP